MKSLENKLITGIIAVSVLLIITGAVSYKTLVDSIQTAQQVSRTYEILTEIELTLSTLKDAETGQRGYLIAGRESYLEPFYQANTHIQEHLVRLKTLTADNRVQRENLLAAEPLINARFELLREAIKLRQTEGFAAAQKQVLSGEGKEKMDALRKLFGEMETEEKAVLQQHLAASEADTRNVVITFTVLFALIISLFCLIFFFVQRDIAARNRLENKLREMATVDELTGVYNRREMNRLLDLEVKRFQRYGSRVSMFLLDIDFFKSVNDTHGHQIGDEVLKWLALKLRESLRTVDVLARYGGEEFAVLLPETNCGEALKIAERARRGIAAKPFVLSLDDEQTLEISITASIGVAELTGIDSETTFIESADKALYQAKAAGRNRVVIAGEKIHNADSVKQHTV